MDRLVSITVLIPAFRSRFLARLLESLCLQTDKDFVVLVCDDASPDPIYEICETFKDRLDLEYFRFESNLGGLDLAAQWNRCFELVNSDWVIMPGDDDTLGEACIEELRAAVLSTGARFAAYRATLRGIDCNDNELYVHRPALIEYAPDRLRALISPDYHGMVIEYLFNKSRLKALGGFVSFPLGWFSDTATWILLAGGGGIYGVEKAIANHRMSGLNISSPRSELDSVKLKSTLLFLLWLAKHRQSLNIPSDDWLNVRQYFKWRLRLHLAKFHTTDFCRDVGSVASGVSRIQGGYWLFELAACVKLKLEHKLMHLYSRLEKSQ
jgi:glycosyltransferase involved in cell wall biosynthesis